VRFCDNGAIRVDAGGAAGHSDDASVGDIGGIGQGRGDSKAEGSSYGKIKGAGVGEGVNVKAPLSGVSLPMGHRRGVNGVGAGASGEEVRIYITYMSLHNGIAKISVFSTL